MEYMNPPEPYEWTPEEIRREALAIGERRAAKVFGLRLADMRRIVRQMLPEPETEKPDWRQDMLRKFDRRE